MEKRTFGQTGLEVSVVGFGGAPIGFQETEQQRVAAILNTLLDEGVNLIDTAAAYDGSEEAIGKAVAFRRDEYVLVSKCGSPGSPGSDAWKDLSEQPEFYQSYAATYTERLGEMHFTPRDLGFGRSDSTAWAELALRFTLSQPGVHTAIIGTTNPDHARANLAAAAKGPLPEDTIRELRSSFRDAQEKAEKDWVAQT